MTNFILSYLKKLLPVFLVPVWLSITKVLPGIPLDEETFIGLCIWAVAQIFRVGSQAVKAEGQLGKKFWKK